MSGAAGAGDQHFQSASLGLPAIAKQAIGRPMGRDDLRLMGDSQLGQQLGGMAHRLPV